MTINSTISARVIANKPLQKGNACKYFKMALALDKPIKKVVPGQFIHIRLDSKKYILPRPFTIYNVIGRRTIEIAYQVVGQGTEIMSHLKPSALVRVLCPLGNGFKIDGKVHPVRKTSDEDKDITQSSKHNKELSNGARISVLVGGGIGSAGLYLLLKQMTAQRIKNIRVFIGARSKSDLCLLPEFRKLGPDIIVATEDGSMGVKGLITTALESFLEKLDIRHSKLDISLYSCGPSGMSQAVRKIALARRIPCQLSLEARMACGVGLCRVCVCPVRSEHGKDNNHFGDSNISALNASNGVCKTNQGYATVCEDGPVFDANQWHPLN